MKSAHNGQLNNIEQNYGTVKNEGNEDDHIRLPDNQEFVQEIDHTSSSLNRMEEEALSPLGVNAQLNQLIIQPIEVAHFLLI